METTAEALPFRMEPGERFAGKYLVDRVLGRGGMAVVVAALHETLGQHVAIKILSVPKGLEPEAVTRFFREARAAAALRSEHVARVIDVGVDALERHYIVMEHLEGEDLGAILAREKCQPIGTSVGYVLHACEAIAEAHSLGIIHRDLKPDNLFVTQRKDGAPLLKVLDFGVSKTSEPPLVRDGASVSNNHALLGTPLYMSPEQARSSPTIDGRSDLWALGVILYELLTARQPFGGDTLADVIASVLTTEPVPPSSLRPEIPLALSDLVLACLVKEPDDRLRSVGILARDLLPWAPRWAIDAATRAARIAGVTALSPEEPEVFALQPEEQRAGPTTDPGTGGSPIDRSRGAGGEPALPSMLPPPAQAAEASASSRPAGRRRWLALLIVAGVGSVGVGLAVRAKRPSLSPASLPAGGGAGPATASAGSTEAATAAARASRPMTAPGPRPRPDDAGPHRSGQRAESEAAEIPGGGGGSPSMVPRKQPADALAPIPKPNRLSKNGGIHGGNSAGRMRPDSADPLGSRR